MKRNFNIYIVNFKKNNRKQQTKCETYDFFVVVFFFDSNFDAHDGSRAQPPPHTHNTTNVFLYILQTTFRCLRDYNRINVWIM